MNAARDTEGLVASAADSPAHPSPPGKQDPPDQTNTSQSVNVRTRVAVFASVAALGLAADWLTKYWIFQWPTGPGRQGEWWLIEDFCGVQHAWNHGALWGMGQGYSAVFAGVSIVAGLGIIVWLLRGGAVRDWRLVIALGGVLGGICGNLYDRLGLWGDVNATGEPIHAVRDWILFRFRGWTWPNFNIADCLLVVGSMLLAWHAARSPEIESREAVAGSEE